MSVLKAPSPTQRQMCVFPSTAQLKVGLKLLLKTKEENQARGKVKEISNRVGKIVDEDK